MTTFELTDYKPDDAMWCAWLRIQHDAIGPHARPTKGNSYPQFSLFNYIQWKDRHPADLDTPFAHIDSLPTYAVTREIVKQLNESHPDDDSHIYAGIEVNRKGFVCGDTVHPMVLHQYTVYIYHMKRHFFTMGSDGSVKFTSESWRRYEDAVHKTQAQAAAMAATLDKLESIAEKAISDENEQDPDKPYCGPTCSRRSRNHEPLDDEAISALEEMNKMACDDDDDE